MKRTSQGLRRAELALWGLGICLLAVALTATASRWSYQVRQERALFDADSGAAGETPRRDSVVVTLEPVQARGGVLAVPENKTAVPPPPVVAPKPQPKAVEAPKFAEKPKAATGPRKPRDTVMDPAAFGRIEIPRIGVRAIVRKGADDETLDRAVGLLPGAALPGEAGNTVLAAHRDTFFRPLRKIRVADRIRLVVPPNEYVYEVESLRVVSPQETSVLQSRGTEELTLVTCYPFGFLGPAPDRFIVSAKRVQ